MAIGTTAAILGAAAIGAGGSILASKSSSKAATKASNAEVQMAQQNNALAREFQAKNQANLQPWLNSGTQANSLVQSFLFGPQTTPSPATGGAPASGTSGGNPTLTAGMTGLRALVGSGFGLSPRLNSMLSQQATPQTTAQAAPQATTQPGANGYDAFVNSRYYQAPLEEGYRAINHGLASRGMLESGNALKAATRFGQDYAHGRMGEFIGLAERQSDQGLRAGGAIAGVGLNALNATSANNSAIGASQAARAVAQGNAQAGLWNNLGSIAGSAIGQLGQSSYGNYAPGTYAGPITVTGYR